MDPSCLKHMDSYFLLFSFYSRKPFPNLLGITPYNNCNSLIRVICFEGEIVTYYKVGITAKLNLCYFIY